jgi:hypothetical protein
MTFRFEGKDYKIGGFDDRQLTYGQKISSGHVDYYGKGLNQDIPLSPGDPTGWYTLHVTVDPGNKVKETNEENNTRRVRFQVVKTQENGQDKLQVANVRILDGVERIPGMD